MCIESVKRYCDVRVVCMFCTVRTSILVSVLSFHFWNTCTESAFTTYDAHYHSELKLLPIRTTVEKVHAIALSLQSTCFMMMLLDA